MGSDKINQAVAVDGNLGAGGGDDAVFGGLEHAVGEGDHGVAEVDDGVARQGLHVGPLAVGGRVVRLDLQAAQPVEQDGDAAEVGVRRQADGVGVRHVRELARQPTVVAGLVGEQVALREGVVGQRQLGRQHAQHRHADVVGVSGEGLE